MSISSAARLVQERPSRLWQVVGQSLKSKPLSFALPLQSPCQAHRTFRQATFAIGGICEDPSGTLSSPKNAARALVGKPNTRSLLILAARFAVCWNLTDRNILLVLLKHSCCLKLGYVEFMTIPAWFSMATWNIILTSNHSGGAVHITLCSLSKSPIFRAAFEDSG